MFIDGCQFCISLSFIMLQTEPGHCTLDTGHQSLAPSSRLLSMTWPHDTHFCVVIFTDQIDIYRAKEHVMLWPGQLRSQGIGAVHGDHSLEGGWWVSDVWQAGSGSEDEDWDVACQCRHNTISCTSHDNSSTLATHLSLVTSWNIIRLEAMIMAW